MISWRRLFTILRLNYIVNQATLIKVKDRCAKFASRLPSLISLKHLKTWSKLSQKFGQSIRSPPQYRSLRDVPAVVYNREKKDRIFYYKWKNNIIDIDVEQYVETTSTSTRAGTSQLLRSQPCKTTTFQSSCFVRIDYFWNYVCKTAPSNSFNTLSSLKTYHLKIYLQLTASAYDPDLLTIILIMLGQMPQKHITYPNVIPPRPLFNVGSY